MLRLTVTVDAADVATYGAGALLRAERGPAWAEFTTIPLVAGVSVILDDAGTDASTYRVRYSTAVPAVAGDYSDYSAVAPAPTLVMVSDLRALVPSGLTDDQLTSIILREEAALARQIGALSGERTQAFYIGDPAARGLWWDVVAMSWPQGRSPWATLWMMSDKMGPLGLLRPADAVTVTDNGVTVDAGDIRLLRRGTLVERASGAWQGPLVEVAYTPNDQLEVVRVVIELCRITMTETGFQSEQIGDYRYDKSLRQSGVQVDPRKALVRSLQTHLPKGTMRIRTSAEDDRIGAVAS